MGNENVILERLDRVKLKVSPDRYEASKRLIQIYGSYCIGNGYFNQIIAKRLQLLSNMTEEELITAFSSPL